MKSRAAVLVVALAASATDARAQTTDVTVRLEVSSELPCATESAVRSRIRSRSDRVRFVASAKRVRARFSRAQRGGVVARLEVERDDGAMATRELRAPSCDEAVDALALVAAVTLDPSLTVAIEDTPRSEPERGEPERGEPERAEPVRSELERAESEPTGRETRELDAQRFGRIATSVGVSAGASFGPAPELLPGAGVYVDVAWQRDGVLSPAGRVHVLRHQRGGFDAPSGRAWFALTAVLLELCPIALGSSAIELRPCAMLTGGVLSAEGSRTEASQTEHRPWWVLGASAILNARPTERLDLSLSGNAGRALVRDRFQFDPEVFHEVAPLAFFVGIGAGLRFP